MKFFFFIFTALLISCFSADADLGFAVWYKDK